MPYDAVSTPPDAPDAPQRKKSGLLATIITLLLLGMLGVGLFLAADRFAGYELQQVERRRNYPRVESTRPVDGEHAMAPGAPIYIELFTPATGKGVDPATVNAAGIRLERLDGRRAVERVEASLTAAPDGGSISLTPHEPLAGGQTYRLSVTGDVLDETGQPFNPFSATFRVARVSEQVTTEGDAAGLRFEQVPLTDSLAPSMYTALVFGPGGAPGERDLFAGTADGRIFRYAIEPDGTLRERAVLTGVSQNSAEPRMITGLAFAPGDSSTLWVSHGVAGLSGMEDFTGKLSTLSGEEFSTYADRVVGLPRAYKDHLNFSIAFSPEGELFLSQGSNTSVGAPDIKWNNRPERLLTAAILKIDPQLLPDDGPLDVRTKDGGGSYDPFAPGAPLTIHATGVRSGFDLLWHSNGRLYTAINGAGRGGTAPGVPEDDGNTLSGAILNVPVTTDDTLADVTRAGTYHGHPNPLRGENVLMGGNPTAGVDPLEIKAYPVGTRPEPSFTMPAYVFGKGFSANGLTEATADIYGPLRGALFAARFSAGDDLILLQLDADGRVTEAYTGIPGLTGLGSPLDLEQDPATGNLYVAEFDQQRLLLLRPTTTPTTPTVVSGRE